MGWAPRGKATLPTLTGDVKTDGRFWTTSLGLVGAPAFAIGVLGDNGMFASSASIMNLVTQATIAAQYGSGAFNITGAMASLGTSLTTAGQFLLTNDVSGAVTVNTNNWAPTGVGTASVLMATGAGAVNITGLTTGADGRFVFIVNAGSGIKTLTAEDALSTDINRFATAKAIPVGGAALCLYDATATRWRVI